MRSDPALVSCIMPTSNRRHLVAQAIAYFLRQDYPRKELIVVDDGDDCIADLVPSDARLRYIRLERRTPLGAKRNLGLPCEPGRADRALGRRRLDGARSAQHPGRRADGSGRGGHAARATCCTTACRPARRGCIARRPTRGRGQSGARCCIGGRRGRRSRSTRSRWAKTRASWPGCPPTGAR